DANALANFCFLTASSNLQISASDPMRYLEEVESERPGVLASQWIPTDPALWSMEHYPDFLEARRELLAAAANELLDSLLAGSQTTTREPLGRELDHPGVELAQQPEDEEDAEL